MQEPTLARRQSWVYRCRVGLYWCISCIAYLCSLSVPVGSNLDDIPIAGLGLDVEKYIAQSDLSIVAHSGEL